MGQDPAISGQEITYPLDDILRNLMFCATYIMVSAVLVRFNKFMMEPIHFPFAVALGCIQMIVSSILSFVLHCMAPSMFPALEGTRGERLSLMKWFIPIGLCLAVTLIGSNKAYVYCSVPLLQFMKEANVMVVFLISCIVGLQSASRVRMALIVWVMVSASVSVTGDITFSWTGVAFQACSQLADCMRVIMGEIVLSERKLDALTYMAFVGPTSAVILGIATACTWSAMVLPALHKMLPLVLLNSVVAFVLNVVVAKVIKEISAVGYVLAGLTKDVVIVATSCVFFSDTITRVQCAGFAVTLAGVGLWLHLKISPASPFAQLLERALCVKKKALGENTVLLEKGATA